MLMPESEIRRVSGITDEQRDAIKHFMQGAVCCWATPSLNLIVWH